MAFQYNRREPFHYFCDHVKSNTGDKKMNDCVALKTEKQRELTENAIVKMDS